MSKKHSERCHASNPVRFESESSRTIEHEHDERHLRVRVTAIQTLILLGAAVLVGFLLLAAAALVPDDQILDRLVTAKQRGELTESWSKAGTGVAIPTEIDCGAISYGTVSPKESTPIEDAIGVYRSAGCAGLSNQIERYASGLPVQVGEPYFRYWRGDSAFAAPTVAALGVPGLRVVCQMLVLASFGLLGAFIAQTVGLRAAIALIVPVAATVPLETLAQSAPHALSTSAGLFGALAVGRVAARDHHHRAVWLWSVGAGAAFVYLDVLTWVPGIWATVIVVTGISRMSESTNRHDLATTMTLAGVGWGFGYASMWAAKWAIASTVFGWTRVWNDVTRKVGERIGGTNPRVSEGLGNSIRRTIATFFDRPLAATVCAVAVVVIAISLRRMSRVELIGRAYLAAPVLIVPAWLEILSQHSQLHPHFVYRSISIGIGLVAMVATARFPSESHAPR